MRSFGELEAVVMERVWAAQSPVSVRQVLEEVREERRLAYTTIMTVMNHLFTKGWLRRDIHGRNYVYMPIISREQYIGQLITEAFARTGDSAKTFLHFTELMSKEETAELRRLLEEEKGK